MVSISLQPGEGISQAIRRTHPNASAAEIQRMTQQVIAEKGLSEADTRRLPIGYTFNVGGNGPATPMNNTNNANTGGGVQNNPYALMEQFLRYQLQQQQGFLGNPFFAQASGNPFLMAQGGFGPSNGLDAYLRALGAGGGFNNSRLLAMYGNRITFGLAGGNVLPFANPNVILRNIGVF